MKDRVEDLLNTDFDRERNTLTSYTRCIERRLSNMEGCFKAEKTRKNIALKEDLIVYKVYMQDVPLKVGELLHCVTVIHPGDVDSEFYMTKGHYHIDGNCAEIYYGQKGQGLLLLQKGNEKKYLEMYSDTIAYIPAGWGHRTVNISRKEPFVFFSVWPAQSGYDYERGIKESFQMRVFKSARSYIIV